MISTPTDVGLLLLQPRHPQWPSGPLTPFGTFYDVLCSASYPVHDLAPEKRYYGGVSPRVCALCARSAPEASFRKISHAIPAALGNRRLISREECDECNDHYSAWESELATLFAPQRILGAVQARDGRPKLSPRGMSSIEATSRNEIRIIQDSRDESILLDIGDGTGSGSLTLSCPAYSPVKAALALLRSLWLVLDADQRRRAPELLRVIKAAQLENTQLHRYTTPGASYPRVVLSGWVKKAPGVVQGATFILQFVFVDTVLTWAWGDESGKECPTLLPPFPGVPEHPIHAGKYLLRDPEHRIEDSTVTYHLSFDKVLPLAECASPPPAQVELPRRPKLRVILEAASLDGPQALEANLVIESWEPNRRTLRLQGGQWPGRIALTLDHTGEHGSFHLHYLHHQVPAADAVAAAEFLGALRSSRSLRIRLADTNLEVALLSLGPEGFPEIPELPLLRDLALIHRTFGVDVRIPKRVTREFLGEASYVCSVLRLGYAEQGGGTASIVLPNEAAFRLVAECERSRDHGTHPLLRIDGFLVTATLEGHELPLGECYQELVVTGARATAVDDATSSVCVEFEKRTDRYPKWQAT